MPAAGTPKKRGRPSKPLLSKTKIADAALELIDEGDVSRFSVQLVADRLGVTAPSIYYYFSDRDDLLRGVGLLVLRELRDLRGTVGPGSKPRPWQDWLRDYGSAIYDAARAHPKVVPILLERKTHGDVADLFEFALKDLVDGGLDPDLALTAMDALEAVVLGWVAFDQAREPNWGFGALDADEHPMMASVLSRQAPAEDRLRQSIDALAHGFEVLNKNGRKK